MARTVPTEGFIVPTDDAAQVGAVSIDSVKFTRIVAVASDSVTPLAAHAGLPTSKIGMLNARQRFEPVANEVSSHLRTHSGQMRKARRQAGALGIPVVSTRPRICSHDQCMKHVGSGGRIRVPPTPESAGHEDARVTADLANHGKVIRAVQVLGRPGERNIFYTENIIGPLRQAGRH